MADKRRVLDRFIRYLFPAVLVAVVIISIFMQPPLISSPEVSEQFREQGARPGFFSSAANGEAAWPGHLPPLLRDALEAAYGPERPVVESFYLFGQAKRRLFGLPFNFGAELVLIPGRGEAVQQGMSIFGFRILLYQTGLDDNAAWRRDNGRDQNVDAEAVLLGFVLEQAALLLPLAEADLTWRQEGPNLLAASLSGIGELVLEFDQQRLVRAALGEQEIILSEPASFGSYTLPSVWTGQYGQAGMKRFELHGLVLNPPFAQDALERLRVNAG